MAKLPDLIAEEIEGMTAFFRQTGNPAAAAAAYSTARKNKRPVPDDIQAEIDRFIGCIADAAEKALSHETDLFGKSLVARSTKDRTPRIPVYFRAPELYAAWRGMSKMENPVGQLQDDRRDMRVFAAIQTLVDRGVRPGRAREIVHANSNNGIGMDSIERIWKRLKTKKSAAIRRSTG